MMMKKILGLITGLVVMSSQVYAYNLKENTMQNNRHNQIKMDKKRCIDDNCFERKNNLKTGFILPQHYRGEAYKVDYRKTNLSRPSNNQQWYKINDDYILLDTEKNRILQIKDE